MKNADSIRTGFGTNIGAIQDQLPTSVAILPKPRSLFSGKTWNLFLNGPIVKSMGDATAGAGGCLLGVGWPAMMRNRAPSPDPNRPTWEHHAMAIGPNDRLAAARNLGEAWASLLAAIHRHWEATAPVPDQFENQFEIEAALRRDDPRSSPAIIRAADDLRCEADVLGDHAELAAIPTALDNALENYFACHFANEHVIYGQYCGIQDEHGYRDEDEFPTESFPLRREAWARLRDCIDQFVVAREGALAECFRLGFDRRALECQLSANRGTFGPWREWPTPADAPHPFRDLREQLDRIRSRFPQLDGDEFDLTEVAFRGLSEPPSVPSYEHWVLQRGSTLIDRIVHDPDLCRAMEGTDGSRQTPGPPSISRVDVHGTDALIHLTSSVCREPFRPAGPSQQIMLELLVDAKQRSIRDSRPDAAIVTNETLNQLRRRSASSRSGADPPGPSATEMTETARRTLSRLRRTLQQHLGPPRGGQVYRDAAGAGDLPQRTNPLGLPGAEKSHFLPQLGRIGGPPFSRSQHAGPPTRGGGRWSSSSQKPIVGCGRLKRKCR